jgi:hypothetical protein
MLLNARINYPGGPLTGIEAPVEFGPDALAFNVAGQQQGCVYQGMRVRQGGFNDGQLELAWLFNGENWQVSVPMELAKATLLVQPPAGLAAELAAVHSVSKKKRTLRGLGWVVLVAGALLLCWIAWWVLRWLGWGVLWLV